LYLLQRNKERAAILSQDDTDSGMSEPEPLSQQSVASTSHIEGAFSIPTLIPPSSQEQSDWEDLFEAGTWMRDGPNWVMEEELFQIPSVPDVSDKALIEPALDWKNL
jgi:hypothetical protein